MKTISGKLLKTAPGSSEIPNLMPHQMEAFNGDSYACGDVLKLKEKFGLSVAIECGTCLGSTALWMSEHFQQVHTIEINPDFFAIAQKRFAKEKKDIHAYCGDTVKILPLVLQKLKDKYHDRIFIYIDSHWEENVPMLDELRIIAEAGIKPVIMIHDFFNPHHPEYGFDSYHGKGFNMNYISDALGEIYLKGDRQQFEFNFNSKATGARRGIVYIKPKPSSAMYSTLVEGSINAKQ